MLAFPQFPQRIRYSAGVAAALLVVIFFLPRGGQWPWQILPTVRGLEFAQLWFLGLGGLTLGAAAILPVPRLFLSALQIVTLFVWMLIGPLPGGLALRLSLSGVAAMLCASLLVRSHLPWMQTPRRIGITMALLIAVHYLWPLPEGLPMFKIASMLTVPTEPAARFMAIYLLLPVPLFLLALLIHIGSELSALGEMLALLIFMWGPGLLLILNLDQAQIYASLITFATLFTASYGLAEPIQFYTLHRDGY